MEHPSDVAAVIRVETTHREVGCDCLERLRAVVATFGIGLDAPVTRGALLAMLDDAKEEPDGTRTDA